MGRSDTLMTDQSLSMLPKMVSVPRAVLAGTLLVIIDAFWLNQGAIAGLVGVGLVLIGLPLALLKKPHSVRVQRLRNLAIYAASVALVFILNAWNNHLAAERAEVVVSAVKAFYEKNHQYPMSLYDLTPQFLDHVPRAKYTLDQNTFYYHVTKGQAVLFYVKFPPFGRPIYRFSEDKWGYID